MPAARDAVADVIAYNRRFAGRYPLLLRQKVARLCRGAFDFFRGTFHLFCLDQGRGAFDLEPDAPWAASESPIVGDIHSENFGTYKAVDGTVRYDIDDFDETCVGNFAFDVNRAATSLVLLGLPLEWSIAQGEQVVETFVSAYVASVTKLVDDKHALTFGYSDKDEPPLAAAKKLLDEAVESKRPEFIEKFTQLVGAKRQIVRSEKLFELSADDRSLVARLLTDYVSRLDPKLRKSDDFYQLEDCCGRMAGCGSLGRLRAVALIRGEGSKEAKNVLLEFKESFPSCWDEIRQRQPVNGAPPRAARVVAAERMMQTASNRHLGWAVDGQMSYQVREIGPRNRRLEVSDLRGTKDFADLATIYAKLLAKCHVRGDAGHVDHPPGQQIAAALVGQHDLFVRRVTMQALAYAERVKQDQKQFVARRAEVEQALGITG